jgi:hypothetical protein
MTETEWRDSADPDAMLSSLIGQASDRKLRLYGVACARRVRTLLTDPRSHEAIEAAERAADGQASQSGLGFAHQAADEAADCSHGGPALVAYDVTDANASYSAAVTSKRAAGVCADAAGSDEAANVETEAQILLLRDIFGNPFRPVTFDPEWRTTTALALAQGIYDERAFDRLPILADALQDAGCDNDDILAHLRDTATPHVRGCWALDLVLGKE